MQEMKYLTLQNDKCMTVREHRKFADQAAWLIEKGLDTIEKPAALPQPGGQA